MTFVAIYPYGFMAIWPKYGHIQIFSMQVCIIHNIIIFNLFPHFAELTYILQAPYKYDNLDTDVIQLNIPMPIMSGTTNPNNACILILQFDVPMKEGVRITCDLIFCQDVSGWSLSCIIVLVLQVNIELACPQLYFFYWCISLHRFRFSNPKLQILQ